MSINRNFTGEIEMVGVGSIVSAILIAVVVLVLVSCVAILIDASRA